MKNRILLLIALCLISTFVRGQSLDSFMSEVQKSHPDLIAAKQLMILSEAESKTGNTPDDPQLSAGYFPVNNSTGADKITWGISQPFDFPTRYSKLKSLKKNNLALAEMEISLTSIDILENTRSMAIEYISLERLISAKRSRLISLVNLEEAYNILLANGETTIVEYNKIKLKQVEFESELSSLINSYNTLSVYLDYSSSNKSNMLQGSEYPVSKIPEIDSLLVVIKANHPAFILPGMKNEASELEVNLTRSEGLPSFELGYSSEIIGTERFTGPSLGMTVPLWKNKGRVKSSRANVLYQHKRAESELLLLESNYKNYYSSYISVVKNIETVSEVLNLSNNKELLNKGLIAGELALTDFLLELGSIYELEDLKINLEKEKHQYLSKLFELDFNE